MSNSNSVFDGMVIFCEVVACGNFAIAAKNLNHSASHISKSISRLENRLATRLLNRTTRTLSLTEMGKIYYQHASELVAEAKCMDERIISQKDKPFGLLRISAAAIFCSRYLNAWLPEFLEQYPDIRLNLSSDDRKVDVVAEGFDVVIRAAPLGDSDLIAKKLVMSSRMTVASPLYIKQHGTPEKPQDITQHKLIAFSYGNSTTVWDYLDHNQVPIQINITPEVVCDTAQTELALAKGGYGITRLPSIACEAEIKSGALVRLLENFEKPAIGIYALYPSRAHLAAKVRAFMDFLNHKFEQEKKRDKI